MIFDGPAPPRRETQRAALRQVLTDLSGPAEPGELTLEAAVLARFRSRVCPATHAAPGAAPHTSPWRRPAPHSPWLAAGLAAAAIVAGGAAAAYAGTLPGPLQNLAHQAIDAPAAHHPASRPPVGAAHHRPGTRPARATSPARTPHSATPASAHAHTQPEHRAHPSRPAHPEHGRPPSAKPSHPGQPQPGRPASQRQPPGTREPTAR